MWQQLAQNSALILGLTISVYTIYSFVETRLTRRRQRYALLQSLEEEYNWFCTLASAMSKRAKQVLDQQHVKIVQDGTYLSSPTEEEDNLPEDVEQDVKWLVDRAEHVIAYPFPVDVEKLGGILSKRQIDALMELIKAHHTYTRVLATRTIDLKKFPRKKGFLLRFAAVAVVNLEKVREHLHLFRESLGFRSEQEHK